MKYKIEIVGQDVPQIIEADNFYNFKHYTYFTKKFNNIVAIEHLLKPPLIVDESTLLTKEKSTRVQEIYEIIEVDDNKTRDQKYIFTTKTYEDAEKAIHTLAIQDPLMNLVFEIKKTYQINII